MFPENPNPSISVLICALDEVDNLPHVLPCIPDWIDEIILVDGHSSDNTVNIAKSIRPEICVLFQPGKGKGDALQHGIRHCNGDIIVTLDADGATPPDIIDTFIRPLTRGFDFAKGTRFFKGRAEGKPIHRTLGNLIIAFTFDLLYLKTYTDLCSGYNAFWRKSIERMHFKWDDGFDNEPLIHARVAKAGLKVTEIGYTEKPRISGEIKEIGWRQGPKAIRTIIRERFQ